MERFATRREVLLNEVEAILFDGNQIEVVTARVVIVKGYWRTGGKDFDDAITLSTGSEPDKGMGGRVLMSVKDHFDILGGKKLEHLVCILEKQELLKTIAVVRHGQRVMVHQGDLERMGDGGTFVRVKCAELLVDPPEFAR
jgi:hypothetical protein